MKRLHTGIIILALLFFWLSACSLGDVKETPKTSPTPEESKDVLLDEEESSPLTFSLSEGVENADTFVPSRYMQGDPLTDEELASLLNRLPALAAGPSDTAILIFRTKSSRRRSRGRCSKNLSRQTRMQLQ